MDRARIGWRIATIAGLSSLLFIAGLAPAAR
jgi:hypothetical protein